jgi:hypothetical protein
MFAVGGVVVAIYSFLMPTYAQDPDCLEAFVCNGACPQW